MDYFSKDEKGKLTKEFSLSPLVQTNPTMGNVAEPDTRHFPSFDVYTHVTYADLATNKDRIEGNNEYAPAKTFTLKRGDTIFTSNASLVFDSLSTHVDKAKYKLEEKDIAVQAFFSVNDLKTSYVATPLYIIHNNTYL